jgi:hypothetical protein
MTLLSVYPYLFFACPSVCLSHLTFRVTRLMRSFFGSVFVSLSFSFSVRFMSFQMKVGYLFYPELLAVNSCSSVIQSLDVI